MGIIRYYYGEVMQMSLYENMKKVRTDNHDSQKDAGERLGISTNTYANYERGDREPGSDFLVRFARLYNVTVDYLLDICPAQVCTTASLLTDQERELVTLFRGLNEAGQTAAIAAVGGLAVPFGVKGDIEKMA